MQYWWIPLATGILAFLGSMGGHFISFNLNSKSRQREVRRTQIEKFAEYISEDQTWMNQYRQEACFRNGKFSDTTAPKDKAYAIYHLYFSQEPELSKAMLAFIKSRHECRQAIDLVYLQRIQLAIDNKTTTESTLASEEMLSKVVEVHTPYYEALIDTLIAASKIARKTIA